MHDGPVLKPGAVRAGDRLAIIAPASPFPRDEFMAGVAEIRRLGVDAVLVRWSDGHQAEYGNRYLRDHCPCAECGVSPRRGSAL